MTDERKDVDKKRGPLRPWLVDVVIDVPDHDHAVAMLEPRQHARVVLHAGLDALAEAKRSGQEVDSSALAGNVSLHPDADPRDY